MVTFHVAHRNMYFVAGILHRDIKPGNILIYPEGEEGNRGILIDYDHAIRVTDTSPYSTKRKIVRKQSDKDCSIDSKTPQ
jgi:serine/threonine protein kinase